MKVSDLSFSVTLSDTACPQMKQIGIRKFFNVLIMVKLGYGIFMAGKTLKLESMYNRKSLARTSLKKLIMLSALLVGCLSTCPIPSQARDFLPGRPDLSVLAVQQRSDTTISPKDLKAYEGYYKFQFEKDKDAFIHITATEKGLVLKQMWDGKEIPFTPQSTFDFVDDSGNFPLKFTKDRTGKFTQVLAFNRDLWTRTNDYKPAAGH